MVAFFIISRNAIIHDYLSIFERNVITHIVSIQLLSLRCTVKSNLFQILRNAIQIEIMISSALGIVPCKRVSRESRDPRACLTCGRFTETRTDWSMIAVDPGDRSNGCERIAPFQRANEDKRCFRASYNNFQLPRINGGPYILRCRTAAAVRSQTRACLRELCFQDAPKYIILELQMTVIIHGLFGRSVYITMELIQFHEAYNIDATMRGCDSCVNGDAWNTMPMSVMFSRNKKKMIGLEKDRRENIRIVQNI